MVSNNDASIVYFEGPLLFTSESISKNPPTALPPSVSEEAERDIIAQWGEMNDFPEQARTAKESNPDLGSALDWKARALYAGGIGYSITDRATGEAAPKVGQVKTMAYLIDQFIYRNRQYSLQAAIDFYDLYNVFPQIILSENRQQIVRIHALEARSCRFKKRDKAGKLSRILIHPDWTGWSGQEDDQKIRKVDIIDPITADPERIKSDKGQTLKYCYPLGYPTGKNYYQLPHWWSIKVSKWLDFGNMIPIVKQTILKNISLIRYHIEMPDYWMDSRYSNFKSMADEEKKKAVEKEFKIINDVLTGAQNAGKNIFTMFRTMIATGKEYGGWKITAIDDKMKDGALLADSSEATIKVFSGTSIDPALHGLIPGKGGSNRSGSDKREALNIYMSLIQAHEDILLDPWNFAAWYNEWNTEDFEVKFHFRKPLLQTLNQVTPAQRATIPDDDAD